jgi:anthranilate synthase component I
VPSQRFSALSPVEAFSIYRGLRTVNPSPYMYFLEFGDFQLAGASPEPLVKVTGRRVETRPIAGTYPRGASEEEDRRRADELLRDPKERAEHVMLVDLGRNDLGRVCEYGSVAVDELMIVEVYSHVLHIVSQVSGRLRDGITAMDALRAILPAGTLSGAPKVRAMQIIDELEPHKRGSYGGAIGYLGFTGDLDTAIHIRTVVVKDGLVHVQAGGGTVADAKPEYEYEESVNKARAIFQAVELAANQPEWP